MTVAVALIGGLGTLACDGELLDASDPDIVTPDQLEGPTGVQNRLSGILFDFRESYDMQVLYTGIISDEYIHIGTFPGHTNADDRAPAPGDLSPQQEWVTPLATTQKTTDELITGFEANVDNPDFATVRETMLDGIALGYLLRGYNLMFWSETFCQSIFAQQDETSPVLPEERIQNDVLPALNNAIDAAQAATGGDLDLTANPNDVVSAAEAGLARAHMFLGNYDQALTHARNVPDGHIFQIDYSANTEDEANTVFGRTFGQADPDAGGRRWSVGLGNDADSDFETYAYADEFLSQGLVVETDLEPQGNGPVNQQQLYDERARPIVLTSTWEARVIEAEILWRQGDVGPAQTMLNDLLDGNVAQNPLLVVNSDLTLDEWRDVTLTGDPENDLFEIGFVRQVGLWQSGQRQPFLRRVFRQDGIDFFPNRAGEAMSFPLYTFELDNNENVSTGCPGGNIPGAG